MLQAREARQRRCANQPTAPRRYQGAKSFNPLFPGNAYSGAVGLLGPTNLTDLTPALTVTPWRGLVLGVEAPSYWRTSAGDGVYITDLRVLVRPEAGSGHYVGTNPGVVALWQATRHLSCRAPSRHSSPEPSSTTRSLPRVSASTRSPRATGSDGRLWQERDGDAG